MLTRISLTLKCRSTQTGTDHCRDECATTYTPANTNTPLLCVELDTHHWSTANTLPGIHCTSPNYICSGCHCRATVKYLSKERSEATERSLIRPQHCWDTDNLKTLNSHCHCVTLEHGWHLINFLNNIPAPNMYNTLSGYPAIKTEFTVLYPDQVLSTILSLS